MSTICSTGFRTKLLGTHSFESLFDGGCIEVYSGLQPKNADMAPTGTLLARITHDSKPWTPGAPANGLTFQRLGPGVTIGAGQPWGLLGLAAGTAGWCRLRGMVDPGGLSTTHPRVDGTIGLRDSVGDFQLRLGSTAIVPDLKLPITSWWFLFPPIV